MEKIRARKSDAKCHEGRGPPPQNREKVKTNRTKIREPQDLAPAPKKRRGRPRKPQEVAPGPVRKRGGQPGNTNAVKTNAHGRERMYLRAANRRLRAIRRRVEAISAEIEAQAAGGPGPAA